MYQLSRKIPGILSRGYFPEIENHWCMPVPDDIEQFYLARSKKHRANLKRCISKLEKEYPNSIKVITYSEEADLDDAIQAAAQISCSTYQRGLGCGFTDDSRTRGLLIQAARQGWLRMSVLYIDGQASAFQIGLSYHREYKLAEIGFDPKWGKFNIGTVLFLKVLEEICSDQDIESFDFGFGHADYKQSYGSQKWQEASVYIFAPRFYPVLVNMLQSSMLGLSLGIEYVLNKTGFTGCIKRHWRNWLQAKNPGSKN